MFLIGAFENAPPCMYLHEKRATFILGKRRNAAFARYARSLCEVHHRI
jgi:hypothetical protein